MTKSFTIIFIVFLLVSFAAPVLADNDRQETRDPVQERQTMVIRTEEQNVSAGNAGVRETMDPERERQMVVIRTEEQNVSAGITGVRETMDPERERQMVVIRTEEQNVSAGIASTQELIRQKRYEMNATLMNVNPESRVRVQNDNEVSLALHTLLVMQNLTGDIGPQVAEIARQFNNSATTGAELEERIETRSGLNRFLFGGDLPAARELGNITQMNEERIRTLQELVKSSSIDAETRSIIEEQIRILQEQQNRLGSLSAREEQDRGIFGWILP